MLTIPEYCFFEKFHFENYLLIQGRLFSLYEVDSISDLSLKIKFLVSSVGVFLFIIEFILEPKKRMLEYVFKAT